MSHHKTLIGLARIPIAGGIKLASKITDERKIKKQK
jgi:hypothetical protein